MLGVAIELRTECGNCGQPQPINACAEHIACSGCGGDVTLPADAWKRLLEDAFEEVPGMEEGDGRNLTVLSGGRRFAVTYGRQAPRCSDCKTDVPDESAGLASRGWIACVGCGKQLSIRPAPEFLTALGASLVIGEDPDQLGGQGGGAPTPDTTAPAPVVLYCPQCQGALSVDGSTRMVRCQYCSADVYLPDMVWQKLHPAAVVTRWYATFSEQAAETAARAIAKRNAFKWDGVADVVVDAKGNLYCVGRDDDSKDFAVWCIGPDFEVAWSRAGLELNHNAARIAFDEPGGRLLVWQPEKHSVTVLSAADGSDLGRLGGREPADATVHHLDMEKGHGLVVDVDGTIVAAIGARLVRFAADGTGVVTWPPHASLIGKRVEKLRPLRDSANREGPFLWEIRNHPTGVRDHDRMCIGANGDLYLHSGEWVARFDRAGKHLYRRKLPENKTVHDIGADGAGNLYVLATIAYDPELRALLRVSPDGRRIDTFAADRRRGGVVGNERRMAAAADGTVYLLGDDMKMRVLGPDGRALHVSDASREDDKRVAKAEA